MLYIHDVLCVQSGATYLYACEQNLLMYYSQVILIQPYLFRKSHYPIKTSMKQTERQSHLVLVLLVDNFTNPPLDAGDRVICVNEDQLFKSKSIHILLFRVEIF